MAWLDRLNRTYTIKTAQSKDNIVSAFKDRIEEANRRNSWLTFKNINYKKIQVDDYRAIIKRDPILFGQYGGIGVIILHFDTNNGFTQINADVKPVKGAFWLLLGFLILFSALCIWFIPGTDKFFMITIAWIAFLTSAYLTIVMYRYRLKKYLKLVLEDIGVQESL